MVLTLRPDQRGLADIHIGHQVYQQGLKMDTHSIMTDAQALGNSHIEG